MFEKVFGGLMVAVFIHGSKASCPTFQEVHAAQAAVIPQLTATCQASVRTSTGAPPTCASAAKVCGLKFDQTVTISCSGSLCASVPSSMLGVTSSVATEQICFPSDCDNEADRTIFLSVVKPSLAYNVCEQHSVGAGSPASLDVTFAKGKMSCDKNSAGEIVIDGTVIKAPCNGDPSCCTPAGKGPCREPGDCCSGYCNSNTGTCDASPGGVPTPMPSNMPTPMPTPTWTDGSMHRCSDVKKAYKSGGCCGNPMGSMSMPRRLASSTTEDELLESMEAVLRQAKAEGGVANVERLTKKIGDKVSRWQYEASLQRKNKSGAAWTKPFLFSWHKHH